MSKDAARLQIPAPDTDAEAAARARQSQLTKPPGSLGRLEELACWFAARLHTPLPSLDRCEIFVFAADHGVAGRGVSAFPQAVTQQMLSNFAAGGAAINVLAKLQDCRIEVVDVGVCAEGVPPAGVRAAKVRAGTRDLCSEAAMTETEFTAALAVGARCAREAMERGAQLLIAGDMGIANTTSAACLICALTGAPIEEVVGRGTGIDDAGLARKVRVVGTAVARVRQHLGIDGSAAPAPATRQLRITGAVARQVFAQLGGLELAAMAGLYLEAARCGVPLLLDGYISGAAALGAAAMEPDVMHWMLAAHRSAETGHAVALEALGLRPLLDLGMRLGEGSGAALTVSLIRAALRLHGDMATFAEAGVAGALDSPSV